MVLRAAAVAVVSVAPLWKWFDAAQGCNWVIECDQKELAAIAAVGKRTPTSLLRYAAAEMPI